MRLAFFSCSTFVLATFALGCDEPIPPTPTGAFLVNFTDTGAACTHASHQIRLGVINKTERTTVAVDGVNGAAVTCTVSGKTLGPFSINADLKADGGDTIAISVNQIDSKATAAAPAKGTVVFASSDTAGDLFSSNEPCDFYIEAAGPSGIGQKVEPGSAWLSFKCPSIVQGTEPCALNESYVVIENCNQ